MKPRIRKHYGNGEYVTADGRIFLTYATPFHSIADRILWDKELNIQYSNESQYMYNVAKIYHPDPYTYINLIKSLN